LAVLALIVLVLLQCWWAALVMWLTATPDAQPRHPYVFWTLIATATLTIAAGVWIVLTKLADD
jgi:hypothetical protein